MNGFLIKGRPYLEFCNDQITEEITGMWEKSDQAKMPLTYYELMLIIYLCRVQKNSDV